MSVFCNKLQLICYSLPNKHLQMIREATRPLYNGAITDLILTNTNKAQSKGTLDWNLSDHLPTFINIEKEKSKFQNTSFTGCSYKSTSLLDYFRSII